MRPVDYVILVSGIVAVSALFLAIRGEWRKAWNADTYDVTGLLDEDKNEN